MTRLNQAVEAARADPASVVLEGFHAVKHALRFDAELTHIYAADVDATTRLAAELAPDLVDAFATRTEPAGRDEITRAAPHAHTQVIGIARRPHLDMNTVIDAPTAAPIVLLEDPRTLGNVGAVVRVAAAADIAGVVTTGAADPWDAAALRGSAGLHFALPVGRTRTPVRTGRPLIGLVPDGDPFTPAALPESAILAFGTERTGLTADLRERCDQSLALPMRPGVSSLNLATSVSAVLFAWRLATGWGRG